MCIFHAGYARHFIYLLTPFISQKFIFVYAINNSTPVMNCIGTKTDSSVLIRAITFFYFKLVLSTIQYTTH